MKKTLIGLSLLCAGAATILPGCSSNKTTGGKRSDKTGWDYNDPRTGGFDVADYQGQPTGPGLVFVEGGRFTMGQTEEDLTMERNNIPRTVSVSSFYMDETEVANVHYREYIYWLTRAYNADYPELVAKALPDTTVWRKALAYNEPFVQYYFRHAAYDQYPVVGVNWFQANAYAKWRSDRVNELILQKRGMLKKNPNQVNEDIYTTETYTGGQYDGLTGPGRKRDLDPNGSKRRNLSYSDGILLPDYRLPTEAEWEYAALGYYGNNPEPDTKRRRGEEVLTHRNVYPWGDPNTTRSGMRNQYQGEFLANFKRQKGDVMGSPAALNDNADIPAPVNSYRPNNIGLYNMAGNVSEWVLDTYRPITSDQESFRPFRGNEYYGYKTNAEDGSLEDKDSLGHLSRRPLTPSEVTSSGRRYDEKSYDVRDYNDGDSSSNFSYDYGKNSLLNNNTKVIKGASWNDYAYWLSPGTRRFMQADHASATVGFRCVMDRLGAPNGKNEQSAGNYFGKGKGKMKR